MGMLVVEFVKEKALQEDNLLDHLFYIQLGNLMEEDSKLHLVHNCHFNPRCTQFNIRLLRELE